MATCVVAPGALNCTWHSVAGLVNPLTTLSDMQEGDKRESERVKDLQLAT